MVYSVKAHIKQSTVQKNDGERVEVVESLSARSVSLTRDRSDLRKGPMGEPQTETMSRPRLLALRVLGLR